MARRRRVLRRVAVRITIALLIGWLGLIAWGVVFAWRKLPHYPLDDPHREVAVGSLVWYGSVIDTHERPYVVTIEHPGGGALLLYGAEHTRDPADPQITDIRQRWSAFKPTVALCESRLGILFPGFMDPVRTFSEPGIVHALAREAGIPTYTWEPPVDLQMHDLSLQPFTNDQLALRVILSPYFSNRRFGRPADPEAVVAETLRDRVAWPVIGGVFKDTQELNAAWASYFPGGPDWRDVSDEYGLPGFLAYIDMNQVRDEHFARVIIELVNKGERVFAVAGSSHAVKLDRPMRDMLSR